MQLVPVSVIASVVDELLTTYSVESPSNLKPVTCSVHQSFSERMSIQIGELSIADELGVPKSM